MKAFQGREYGHQQLPGERSGANMKTSSIRDVLNLGFLNRRETLIISGSINSDMNALARALGMKAEREGRSVMTVNAGMLHEELAEAGETGLSAVKLVGVAKPQLLIIENFGMKKFAHSQTKILAQLVTERINRSSTIITSGYPLREWTPLIGASVAGKSLIRSLSIHARQVVIGSKEPRAKKKPAPVEVTVQAHG
jgi:DNA replication protein DnaC